MITLLLFQLWQGIIIIQYCVLPAALLHAVFGVKPYHKLAPPLKGCGGPSGGASGVSPQTLQTYRSQSWAGLQPCGQTFASASLHLPTHPFLFDLLRPCVIAGIRNMCEVTQRFTGFGSKDVRWIWDLSTYIYTVWLAAVSGVTSYFVSYTMAYINLFRPVCSPGLLAFFYLPEHCLC